MPKSNGRPANRRRKSPRVDSRQAQCSCGAKATKYGKCIRCLDVPLTRIMLQAHGIYLPSRKERRQMAESGVSL
jgi:hypothetical protein